MAMRATALLVTRDQPEALAMGHLVAVLRQGKLAQVGGPEMLYRRPAHAALAPSPARPCCRRVSPQTGMSPATLAGARSRQVVVPFNSIPVEVSPWLPLPGRQHHRLAPAEHFEWPA